MLKQTQKCVTMKSRMTGDCHVRFCEGLGVKIPLPTRRPVGAGIQVQASNQLVRSHCK